MWLQFPQHHVLKRLGRFLLMLSPLWSDSLASLFHLSRTLVMTLGPWSPIIWGHFAISGSPVTPARSHLPPEVTQPQAPGLRMWTSLGTIILPATVPFTVPPSLGRSHLLAPRSPRSRHSAKEGSTKGPDEKGGLPPQLPGGPEARLPCKQWSLQLGPLRSSAFLFPTCGELTRSFTLTFDFPGISSYHIQRG